jgi:hypothetical protein
MKTAARVLQIAFPVICLMTVILNRLGIVLIDKNVEMVLLVIFYTVAATYTLSLYFFEASVIGIVFIFIFYLSLLFLDIPFLWIIAIAILPNIYLISTRKGYKAAAAVLVIGIIVSSILVLLSISNGFVSTQKAYFFSPDKKYTAEVYISNQGAMGGEEEVNLYRNFSPFFAAKIKNLYYYNNSYMQWKENIPVWWIDNNTIEIDNYPIKIN